MSLGGPAADASRIREVDRLFVGVLHVADVRLPGIVQALDFHLFRHRMQRSVESSNYAIFTHAVQLLTVVCMLTAPESTSSVGWYDTAQALLLLCLVLGCIEVAVAALAYGVMPNSSSASNSSESQRIRSVLTIWSPPRLRQSSALLGESTRRDTKNRGPLLTRPEIVAECILLLLSIIGYLIPVSNAFGNLRYAHGLRCLRLVSVLAAMESTSKHLSATLMHAVPMLATAATFLAFFFVVFGVLGVDPFKGALSYRCRLPSPYLYPNLNYTAIDPKTLCRPSSPYICVDAFPVTTCPSDTTEENFLNPYVCPAPQVCRKATSPYNDLLNFDDITRAWLMLLQITSLSQWSDLLYSMWTAFPRVATGGYCFLVIIVVTFIMCNLVTAIVSSSYGKSFSSASTARLGAVKRSVLAIELERFANWGFPQAVVHYLCFEDRTANRFERIPFYKSIEYGALTDLLLAVVVSLNAANDAKASSGFANAVGIVEICYTAIFGFEVLLSIIASGCIKQYLSSKLRQYDLLCFALICTGLIIQVNLSPLRSLRFIRWLTHVPFIRGILVRIGRIIRPTVAISAVLGTYVVVFAAVCTQMFDVVSNRTDAPSTAEQVKGQWGYDGQADFFRESLLSLRTMFRFVTVDGWEEPMYTGMQQLHWTFGIAYFVPVYFLFGFVLTSLYIAVIIEAFNPSEDEKLSVQRRQLEIEDLTRRRPTGRQIVAAVLDSISYDADEDLGGDPHQADAVLALADQSARAASKPSDDVASAALDHAVAEGNDDVKVQKFRNPVADASLACFGVGNPLRRAFIRLVCEVDKTDLKRHETELAWSKELIKPAHQTSGDKIDEIRKAAQELPLPNLYGAVFGWSIMLVVVLSCVQVFMDTPNEACSKLDNNAPYVQQQVFFAADIVFVIIFTMEALIKIVALSAFFTGDDRPWYIGSPYFRDGWNMLDFFLLVTMFVSFLVPQAQPLRILRTLRPLRVIRRVRRMRHMMTGLVSSMPSIIVVFFVMMYIAFVCSIIGVNMFAGRMNFCTVSSVGGEPVITSGDCRGHSFNDVGILSPNSWRRPTNHFDHVGAGMVYMIQIASLSEWAGLMRQVTDVVGVDLQPQRNNHVAYSVFFVILAVVLSLVATKLLVGLLMYHFDAHRGVLLLTDAQKDWHNLRVEILALRPIPAPPRTIFARLQPIVSGSLFDNAINIVVFLNILLLASSHVNQSSDWSQLQYWGNIVFLAIFCIEFILKIMAYSYHYFKNPWNVFDFLILLGSLIEFTIEVASGGQGSAIVTVGRTFRILRVFRSVKRITYLRNVFHTLALAFFSILSVTALIVIVVFIFGVLGRNLFGNIRHLTSLNRNANFRDLDVVFFLMVRLLTLDRWAAIMNDAQSYYAPFCNNNQPGWTVFDERGNPVDCGLLSDCSSESSQIFFLVFYAVGSYLVLSVMVAMLLENFKFIATQTRVPINLRDFDSFQRAWLHARRQHGVEEQYEGFIEPHLLSSFIIDLFNRRNALVMNPEGIVIHPVLSATSRLNFRKLKFELDALGRHRKLPTEQAYTFHAVLMALARMQLGIRILTIKQRTQRAYFDSLCSIALIGDRLRKQMTPWIIMAKKRAEERRFAVILQVDNANNDIRVDSDGDTPDSPGLLRRTGGHPVLRKKGSRVNFVHDAAAGTPESLLAVGTHASRSAHDALTATRPRPLDATAASEVPTPLPPPANDATFASEMVKGTPGDPPFGRPEDVKRAAPESTEDNMSSPRGSIAESPYPELGSRAQSTSQAELTLALGNRRLRRLESAQAQQMSEQQHPVGNAERAGKAPFKAAPETTYHPKPTRPAAAIHEPALVPVPDTLGASAAGAMGDAAQSDGESSASDAGASSPPPVGGVTRHNTADAAALSPSVDRNAMIAFFGFYRRMEAIEEEEEERRHRKQREYTLRVWRATRLFIESVEAQYRGVLQNSWRDVNWEFKSLPRNRHASPPRNPISRSLPTGIERERLSDARLVHEYRGGDVLRTPTTKRRLYQDQQPVSTGGRQSESTPPTARTGFASPLPPRFDVDDEDARETGFVPPPMCPWDLSCADVNRTSHQVLYRHTCRETPCTKIRSDPEHARVFFHPAEAVVFMS